VRKATGYIDIFLRPGQRRIASYLEAAATTLTRHRVIRNYEFTRLDDTFVPSFTREYTRSTPCSSVDASNDASEINATEYSSFRFRLIDIDRSNDLDALYPEENDPKARMTRMIPPFERVKQFDPSSLPWKRIHATGHERDSWREKKGRGTARYRKRKQSTRRGNLFQINVREHEHVLRGSTFSHLFLEATFESRRRDFVSAHDSVKRRKSWKICKVAV